MPFPGNVTVSGVGTILFGGFHGLEFIGVRVTVLGSDVRRPYVADSEHLLRVGYVAVGWHDDTLGVDRWLPPHWVNFIESWFQFTPADIEADPEWDRIRYSFSPGTECEVSYDS